VIKKLLSNIISLLIILRQNATMCCQPQKDFYVKRDPNELELPCGHSTC
jgi:hypothetical protein